VAGGAVERPKKAGRLPDFGERRVRAPRTPSLRLHKPSGQAVVTLDDRPAEVPVFVMTLP
jgi:hypothetical protein